MASSPGKGWIQMTLPHRTLALVFAVFLAAAGLAAACPALAGKPVKTADKFWRQAISQTDEADNLFRKGSWREAAVAYVKAGRSWAEAAAHSKPVDRKSALTNCDTARRNGQSALCNYLRRQAARFNDEAAIKYDNILNSLSMAVAESVERPVELVAAIRSTPSRLEELEELYDSSKDYWSRAAVICRGPAKEKAGQMAVATIEFIARIRETKTQAVSAQTTIDDIQRRLAQAPSPSLEENISEPGYGGMGGATTAIVGKLDND